MSQVAGGHFRDSVALGFQREGLCQSVTASGEQFDVCATCTVLSGAPGKADGRQVSAAAWGSQLQDISVDLTLAGSQNCSFGPRGIIMSREAKPG